MTVDYSNLINRDRARIFRIVHRANLPWVLAHGLHCGNGPVRSSGWVSIGNQELITKRASWPVPVPPGGVLNDYVPFYFTPFSPMMFNILTGYNGIAQHARHDILILVSDLRRLVNLGATLLFTDSHANTPLTEYHRDLADLSCIDWSILQTRDFKTDHDDPRKRDRYQAEALIHRHLPLQGLSGVVCYSEQVKIEVEQAVAAAGASLPVACRPSWYF